MGLAGTTTATRGEGSENTRARLNEVSNCCLQSMLKGNDAALVEAMFEVEQLAETWESSSDAGKYCRVLLSLLNHEYDPSLVADGFESDEYGKSVEKMYAILEDSGWKITVLGGAEQQQDLLDDELMQPPPSFTSY
ncbi:hypothetical protein HOP50_03g22990 [Chloropicon primus]|uniref:Uncharacterized protein n=2 Tax=Chloropicon primus TaxID=1764295 RepID=A0A5B8MK98_9CHLO|nr:hypothetical protein A3770_03p23000 [Chloropicon primus]UPQ98993.1 hypothetical protein HOP50_03g22990 [Chloropicon primus]|eukprot:QDZ19782.1 hypothetical protein A3770_03p23000 [Chloropicon primus]